MLLLNYNQEKKIKDILAYYNNSVVCYCKVEGNMMFRDKDDIHNWFSCLNWWDNFYSKEIEDYILENKVENVHDFLMIVVKQLKLKRDVLITDERRSKLHMEILKLREKYRLTNK